MQTLIKFLRKYLPKPVKKVIRQALDTIIILIPDKIYLKWQYKKHVGKKLNLKNPKNFTEKIQYIKVYYRNNLMTLCADKYKVREYVRKKINEDIIVPLLWMDDKPGDIPFDKLPDSFVIKTNHGSGMNILVKNKNLINKNSIIIQLKSWLKINYYHHSREWTYKNIERKILVEKNLGDNVNDYKVFVFNGNAKFIQIDSDRFINHKRNFYDLNWEQLNIKLLYENTTTSITPPSNLKKMIAYAEILATEFPFARVDFYEVEKKLYFGEITFYPEAGWGIFLENDDEIDLKFGNLLRLPYRK